MDQKQVARLTPAELVEAAICRHEGVLLSNGSFCAHTGKFTGRSPKDKYFVGEGSLDLPQDRHRWLTEDQFDGLHAKVLDHLGQRGSFVFDAVVNRHPDYRVPIRFQTEFAWHNLFVQRLFMTGSPQDEPLYTVYSAPTLRADPVVDGTRGGTFIVLHPAKGIVLIGGTEYAGELKKSIFSLMHLELPRRGVMPMHCSASVGERGDVALFFGLSGTGKTTLSADPIRRLIGDDEHGWSDDGVFNMENGCYAKCIHLTRAQEPDIYDAIRFGAVLENVGYDEARQPLYDDATLTENTRAAYPLSHIRNIEPNGRGGHPQAIVFLSADATGVLPAVARLSPDDARRHYLLGYTSKLAGTERGVVQPESTFSACFGAPFLTDRPIRYAQMLMERVARYTVPVYLLNTGWVGGAYGETGRMPLAITRELVRLILTGDLEDIATRRDDELFLHVPLAIPGVPLQYLQPQDGCPDGKAFAQRRTQLVDAFARTLASIEEVVV